MRCRRRHQRGAISVAAVGGVLVLAVVAMGAISIGRITATRSDAQSAADSAALAAAQMIRDRGLPFTAASRAAAESLAQRNSQLPVQFQWNISQTPDEVVISVQTAITLNMPTLVFSGGSTTVNANASARIAQTRFDDAERRLPKLVMALDYSGSMTLPFSGGGSRAIDVLESSVAALLGTDLMIDYGAAFYSTSVFRTVAISDAAPNQIVSIMNTYDAGGSTNTAAAINSARNLVSAGENTGRYILLVSDGEPCCGGGAFSAARNAARTAWNRDITIFTLEIRRQGSSAALSQFMTDVAGSPSSRRDPNYHFVATTASDLVNKFQDIVASIVCKVGPMSPAPSDPSLLRVYLSSGGSERAVPASTNLAADRNLERFRYETADRTIRLTERACDAVIENGDEIVVRFDKPGLTD